MNQKNKKVKYFYLKRIFIFFLFFLFIFTFTSLPALSNNNSSTSFQASSQNSESKESESKATDSDAKIIVGDFKRDFDLDRVLAIQSGFPISGIIDSEVIVVNLKLENFPSTKDSVNLNFLLENKRIEDNTTVTDTSSWTPYAVIDQGNLMNLEGLVKLNSNKNQPTEVIVIAKFDYQFKPYDHNASQYSPFKEFTLSKKVRAQWENLAGDTVYTSEFGMDIPNYSIPIIASLVTIFVLFVGTFVFVTMFFKNVKFRKLLKISEKDMATNFLTTKQTFSKKKKLDINKNSSSSIAKIESNEKIDTFSSPSNPEPEPEIEKLSTNLEKENEKKLQIINLKKQRMLDLQKELLELEKEYDEKEN